jgi:hypothetical protein
MVLNPSVEKRFDLDMENEEGSATGKVTENHPKLRLAPVQVAAKSPDMVQAATLQPTFGAWARARLAGRGGGHVTGTQTRRAGPRVGGSGKREGGALNSDEWQVQRRNVLMISRRLGWEPGRYGRESGLRRAGGG